MTTRLHYPVRTYAYKEPWTERESLCGHLMHTLYPAARAEYIAISAVAWHAANRTYYTDVEQCETCLLLSLAHPTTTDERTK